MVYERFGDDVLNIEPRNQPLGICKRCGKKSPAKDFRIHDHLGFMVCKNCFSEVETPQKKKVDIKESVEREVIHRTIIIRKEEDAFRDFEEEGKISQNKKLETKKEDDPYSRILCTKCGFRFRYNERKNWPNACPACGRDMKSIKRGIYS